MSTTKQTVAKPITTATPKPILKPPPNKTQPLDPTRRLAYRPNLPTLRVDSPPPPKFNGRRFGFLICLWSILIIIFTLVAISAVFYVVYDPRRPTFTVTAIKLTSFNLTTVSSEDTTLLTTNLNLTLTAKNPNKKITYFFNHVSINVRSSSVSLASGDFMSFTNLPNDVFVMHTVMGHGPRVMVDPDDLNVLKNDLKNKNGLPVNVVVESKVGVKVEKRKMVNKVGFKVTCDGIRGKVPIAAMKGKRVIPAVADVSKAMCKVEIKIKIFGWAVFI